MVNPDHITIARKNLESIRAAVDSFFTVLEELIDENTSLSMERTEMNQLTNQASKLLEKLKKKE